HMQTVAGTLTVTVNASDDRGVEMAALYIDGVRFADDLVAPYEFVWDTTAYANGQHTLTAKAYDAVGNEGLDEITVFVDNASGDTTPPAVQILSPPDGDVSKVVRVLVEAVDDTRVDQVAFYIDGSLYRSAACDGPACTIKFNWNTRRESKGPHTLQAVAFDAAGNRGESEPVNVNVK
ncbi:MAG: peptidase S8, partial [Desulfobacterales bacterium]